MLNPSTSIWIDMTPKAGETLFEVIVPPRLGASGGGLRLEHAQVWIVRRAKIDFVGGWCNCSTAIPLKTWRTE